ncbi:hypothetical protein J3Q64DRAFT_1719405 [Phycomyces blakesleeanus]|uniref:Uncharacterized protein n=1 Tax=Phycomyces blakesleeanus TaxID=4837 RepID=A0ABR3B979_PHYBL
MDTTKHSFPEVTLTTSCNNTPITQCMNLWKHKMRDITKIKSPRASHRISTPLPRTRLVYDKIACSPFLCSDNYHKNINSHKAVPVHPLMEDSSCKALVSVPHVTVNHSSHQLSWVPAHIHQPQPKICTMTCIGRDEQEVVRKIRQIIKEHMGGNVTENLNDHNNSQKGDMLWEDQDGEQSHLRFNIEVTVLPGPSDKQHAMQVCFLEQDGNSVVFGTAVRHIEKALEAYELEVKLISAANGWDLHSSS